MIFLMMKSRIVLVLDVGGVLGGDDHVGDPHRLAVFVLHRDLALGVRTEPLHFAGLADPGQLAAQPMGKHDRRRHQLRRFVAGITEHQPLVARALLRGRLCPRPRARRRLGRCPGFGPVMTFMMKTLSA